MKLLNVSNNFSYFRYTIPTMKPIAIICLLLLSLLRLPATAQQQQIIVPYTLADRDRAMLIEAKLTSLETKMEVNFASQRRQIDDLKTLFYGGFSILITLFLFMFGYIIWDRRTAMKPALEQASKAMMDSRNFITVLRDYSRKHPDLAEILKAHGLL